MLRLTLGIICVACSTVQAGDVLEWESTKGHKTQATFEGLEVVITKENGQKIRVPFNALSMASQQQALRLALRLMKEAEVPQVPEVPEVPQVLVKEDLSPARVRELLQEINEIYRQAKLQGSTAKYEIFLKEEMDKLDKKHGKFKVKFSFPVEDVSLRDGSYKLSLSQGNGPLGRLHGGLYLLRSSSRGVISVGFRGSRVYPVVTKQEMMEIGEGTHKYEVICEMTIPNLLNIVRGDSSPSIRPADCKLVKSVFVPAHLDRGGF